MSEEKAKNESADTSLSRKGKKREIKYAMKSLPKRSRQKKNLFSYFLYTCIYIHIKIYILFFFSLSFYSSPPPHSFADC